MDELNDLMPISPDLNRERLDTLKQLFPDLFTNEGKLNPDELKNARAFSILAKFLCCSPSSINQCETSNPASAKLFATCSP